MSATWWTRFVIVVFSVLWGIWTLIPTLTGKSAEELHAEAAKAAEAAAKGGSAGEGGEDAEASLPWYAPYLPDSRIELGLDLQGGIDMTLQVEVDEAVISTVQRDLRPLQDAADKEGLELAEVIRARGEPTILIRPGQGVGKDAILGFMDKRYSTYEFQGPRTVDGVEYLAFTLSQQQADYIKKRAVEQALETLRNRIDETGVKEPSIVLKGGNRINVQLPGQVDVQSAVQAIGTTAVLEFMMVDEEAMAEAGKLERALLEAERTLDPETFNDDRALSDWLVSHGKIPRGDRLLWKYKDTPDGEVRSRSFIVKDEVILTGDDINDAHVAWNQFNEPYVALEFKPRGANIFAEVTGENVGRRFAIVLDEKVESAPVIRERIGGGRASIEMGVGDVTLAQQEAKVLALVLRTGALPAPVTIGEIRTVGASLGADAIAAGEEATVVGFGFVLAFMLLYYKRSGVISVVALVLNVVLVLALLATAGATLTLPGIAGIALTVGMAVDCNIIIYERIREELALGKNARAAADAGFDKGTLAVIDANVTTFIAGVVLYTYGTGPIKGFAVTLMIGIITTLFTGIFVTRTFMDLLTRRASARVF